MSSRVGQSSTGKWSLALSMAGGVFTVGLLALGYLARYLIGQDANVDAPGAALLALLLVGVGLLLTFVALALGIYGMLQRQRKRTLAVMGTVVSLLVLLGSFYGWLWPIYRAIQGTS